MTGTEQLIAGRFITVPVASALSSIASHAACAEKEQGMEQDVVLQMNTGAGSVLERSSAENGEFLYRNDDGTTTRIRKVIGSVGVLSLLLYNLLASDPDKISDEDVIALLSKNVRPTGATIENRDVYFEGKSDRCSLIVFEGGHEMLVKFAFNQLVKQAEVDAESGGLLGGD